ncbi:hypothetical protein XM25_08600 [Devosia sp. H5989]|nr:hypothetical protein XM25_08600 [Devosia sp. H5989]
MDGETASLPAVEPGEIEMSNMAQRERAQLGLQYIEDAIVDLLSRHADGMTESEIADALGLETDLPDRDAIAAGIVRLLVETGRILWDDETRRYLDNPDRT